MKTNTTTRTHIRWMIRRDMPEVLEIEQRSFQFHWGEEEFLRFLRKRNVLAFVAERDQRVVAFYLYELAPTQIHLLRIAVDPEFRSEGVGTACIDKLKEKLNPLRRKRITANVPETLLPAQKFFAARGFEAVSVLHGVYEESDEDAFRFVFRI